MYQLTVGEFKSKFSKVLEKVLQGETVAISYGKSKKKVAALIPYEKYSKTKRVRLGSLEGKATYRINPGFKMTEEEFLNS